MSATTAHVDAFMRVRGPAAGTRLLESLRTGMRRQNWALYLFVLLIPLQNIYTQYVPLGRAGLNFINVMFAASLLMALACGGRLVRGCGVNGWLFAYMAVAAVALVVGFDTVADPSGHVSHLKDQLIGMSFVFLAQMSTRDWGSVRRLLLISLLPLPYMTSVLIDQHSAVSSWHYDHALRVSGTFPQLGANEFAAFCVTALLLSCALLVTLRLRWGWRLVLAGAALCTGVGVVLTYSRTAYIAVLLGLAVLVVLRHRASRMLLPVLLAIIVVPPMLPPSVIERFQSIEVGEDVRDESTDNRFVYWGIALERFGERPLLGVGYHAFHHAEVNPHRTDTHNFFLRELVEKGIAGGIVVVGLFWAVWRTAWRLRRRSQPGGWGYGLGLAMLAAVLALACGNVFGDRFTYNAMIAHFWLYVGLSLRAWALLREQQAGVGARSTRDSLPMRQATARSMTTAPRTQVLVNRWNPPA